MVRIVFDTSALLAHSNDESNADDVEKQLKKLIDCENTGIISAVTVSEFTEKVTRNSDRKTALNALNLLEESGIVVMEVTEEIARLSGPLKAQYPRLSTADAIIIATAYINKAKLFTFDKGFLGIGGVDIMGLDI